MVTDSLKSNTCEGFFLSFSKYIKKKKSGDTFNHSQYQYLISMRRYTLLSRKGQKFHPSVAYPGPGCRCSTLSGYTQTSLFSAVSSSSSWETLTWRRRPSLMTKLLTQTPVRSSLFQSLARASGHRCG